MPLLALSMNLHPPQAVLTCHYSVHCGFLGESELLPDAMPTLRRIPCVAFQGANDMICPPATAWALHRAWPEMVLHIKTSSGHSMYDPKLMAGVLDATDRFADEIERMKRSE